MGEHKTKKARNARGKLFTRLCAARGGSSLDDNPALRLAFTRSRAANIPATPSSAR